MEEKTELFVRGYEHLTTEEKYRARRADAIYNAAFDEAGLKLDAFQRTPTWVNFVEGEIDEGKLWERVLEERDEYARLVDNAA